MVFIIVARESGFLGVFTEETPLVKFRTSDLAYGSGSSTIAVNTDCDGSDLIKYTSFYTSGSKTCSDFGHILLIDELPFSGGGLGGAFTCDAPPRLSERTTGAHQYVVCCNQQSSPNWHISRRYDITNPIGTESAISSVPSNEILCSTPPAGDGNAQFSNYDFSFNLIDQWYSGYSSGSDGTSIWIHSSGPSPSIEKYNLDGTYIENWNPDGEVNFCGMDADDNYIWLCKTDITMPYTKHIKWYTHDKTEIGRFNLDAGNSNPRGMVVVGSSIFVGDANDNVYEYNLAGTLITTHPVMDGLVDLTYLDGIFYFIDIPSFVVSYDSNWVYLSSDSINSDIDFAYGIANDGTNIWITDATDDQRKMYRFPQSSSCETLRTQLGTSITGWIAGGSRAVLGTAINNWVGC